MRKNYIINALFVGAMALFSFAFAACNNEDLDDLKTRVTVLEGKIHELEDDLQAAMVTGATITNATNVDGVWTLTLSDGKVITINPTPAGGQGGIDVSVEETEDAYVITINGTAYALPKASSAALNSLVYVPEYEDGMVLLGNEGAEVRFLAVPALTASDIEDAVFEIADAREVKTRAGSDLMKVESVAIDGDLLKVVIKGLAVEADKQYVVAIKATVKGTAISSNYFNVYVGDGFSFESEVLEEPSFKEGVEVQKAAEGFHSILIPNSALTFVEGFNLKDYYASLPEGNIAFQLAPAELQNANVQKKYDMLKASLAADGTFAFTERPGTDFSDADPNISGILIYMTADDVIKNKVFWRIYDPIPALNLPGLESEFGNAPHLEYGYWVTNDIAENFYLNVGENEVSFPELFNKHEDYLGLMHDGGKMVTAWAEGKLCAVVDGEDLFYTDGDNVVLGDYGKKITGDGKYGRGIWWQSTQPSIAASLRLNWAMAEEEKLAIANSSCNGEIIGGWDGIKAQDMIDLGFEWDTTGKLRTTAAYTGVAARFGVGIRFEYAYGNQKVGAHHFCYLWFNRRVSPEGVVDVSPR